MPRRLSPWIGLLATLSLSAARAQLALGTVEGKVQASADLEISGVLGMVVNVRSDARGHYSVAVPYGEYTVRAVGLEAICRVRVRPFEIARCDLAGETQSALPPSDAVNAAERALYEIPGSVTNPLDFAWLGTVRLPLISNRAVSWTATTFRLNGLDAIDSYQPGKPVTFDDVASEDSAVYREDTAGIYLRGAENSWHGGLATADTGSILGGDNRPPPPARGIVQRPEEFRWFTRDTAEVGGPLTRWADISAIGTAQWGSQTVPQRASGAPMGSRMLFGNTRGRMRLGARDQVDALYSGSRLDLSNGGWPAGMEAILVSRKMPSFYGVEGFENLRETDHLDLAQAGWTHQFTGRQGVLEVRYGYSTAHLDTSAIDGRHAPVIDLLDPAPADSPISNFAVRTRHEIEGAYTSGKVRLGGTEHRFTAGSGWEESHPRNRFQTPLNTIQISAAGQPAFVVHLNTPADTQARIRTFDPYVGDAVRFGRGVTVDAGVVLDVAQGVISWTSAAPRLGIAVPVPEFSRVTLRGSYARTYSRLAGQYLDFAGSGALSGLISDAATGRLLERFGGAYCSIAPGLKRPYADEFRIGAEFALPRHSAFSVDLVRRDDKDRLAAVNTGVPASSYRAVTVLDPGPDSVPGTFDDEQLVVYAQDPSTLGRDQYLLTNPAGLRELSEALTATLATHRNDVDVRVSFTAEKAFGATNPGNSVWSNDPGVVGALYSDPNTLIHGTGHPYMDRAFLGKFQAVLLAPEWLGSLHLTNTINYLDGLPFARESLITGLPQGPFLVSTTLRGSPEGGNRAQYVLNWNLRAAREFHLPFGRVTLAADLLNVLNNGNTIVQNDLSGPLFNQRPAIAIPPPRTLRLEGRWQF